MERNCLKCHFLALEYYNRDNTIDKETFNEDDRKNFSKDIEKMQKSMLYSFSCHKNIWICKKFDSIEKIKLEIIEKNRKDCVFYHKFNKNITLNAIENVIEKVDIKKSIKRNFIISIIAITISLFSIFKDFIFELFSNK